MKTEVSTATTPVVVGEISLQEGDYLLTGAASAVREKPQKDSGYLHLNGGVLTLHNFSYNGSGLSLNEKNIGIYVKKGTVTLKAEGENTVAVDALNSGFGIYLEKDAVLKTVGPGTLHLMAQNGKCGNCGIGGEGTFEIKKGTLRINAGLAQYEARNDKKLYYGDSYAVNVGKFIDNRAKIQGNDNRGNVVNKNITTEVVYSFSKKIPWLIWLLGGITLITMTVTVWSLFFREPVVLTPDYAPVEEEVHAESIPDEKDTEKIDTSKGGGGLAMMYSDQVKIDLSDKSATLFFGNPSKSVQDVVLQVVVQETVIAQSGTLNPGMQVQQLDILKNASEILSEGGYDGILRVLIYDPETGERAIITNDIKAKITVQP